MNEVKEAKELLKFFPLYRYAGLYNKEGGAIIRPNKPNSDYNKKQTQIITHLESELTAPGLYVVKLKNDLQKGSAVNEIFYRKGEAQDDEIKPTEQPDKMETARENFLSYDKALKYERDILTLKNENENLRAQLEEMNEELSELEEEAEEATSKAATLAEAAAANNNTFANVLSGLKEILPTISGFFNTHFELKERQIRALEGQQQQPAPQQQPKQQAAAVQLDADQIQIFQYLEILKREAPEEYNKILDSLKPDNNGQ